MLRFIWVCTILCQALFWMLCTCYSHFTDEKTWPRDGREFFMVIWIVSSTSSFKPRLSAIVSTWALGQYTLLYQLRVWSKYCRSGSINWHWHWPFIGSCSVSWTFQVLPFSASTSSKISPMVLSCVHKVALVVIFMLGRWKLKSLTSHCIS